MICQEGYIKSDMSRVKCQEWYVKSDMSIVICPGSKLSIHTIVAKIFSTCKILAYIETIDDNGDIVV